MQLISILTKNKIKRGFKMSKIFFNLIAIAVLFFISNTNAQLIQQWAVCYAGITEESIDIANCIAVDVSGNCYVTGVSDNDYATVGYNASGSALWDPPATRFHSNYGSCKAIWIDIQKPYYDIVYVTGYTQGENYEQITTIAYRTSDGGVNWTANFTSPYGNCRGSMVRCDIAGNVYVMGERTGNGTYKDYVVIKYDLNGQAVIYLARCRFWCGSTCI
jgi:hypothetical protein